MTSPSFVVERRGSVLHIELVREQKRNAIDTATVTGLAEAMQSVPDGVGCVVLSARGEHFSAGLDLSELVQRDARGGIDHSRLWHRCLDDVQYAPVPVVAALHGAVIGGGLELAAATHVRVADTSTYYALPEGARGIFVGGGGSARLTRLMGYARMADMMLTGRVLDADQGLAAGLSQYVVPAGEALATAFELAERIAENTGLTNYAVTHVLPRIADSSQEAGLLTESLIASLAQSDPRAKQRLEEFLSGRATKVRPQ
jgi:(methylthio)acryloyl-CoA hydratase